MKVLTEVGPEILLVEIDGKLEYLLEDEDTAYVRKKMSKSIKIPPEYLA